MTIMTESSSQLCAVAGDNAQAASKHNQSVNEGPLFTNVDDAVAACIAAQSIWAKSSVALRGAVVSKIRQDSLAHAEELAKAAREETRMGRVEDKISKNILAANKSPGPENVQPNLWTGDSGMTFVERGPMGVLGAVTPVTNPTATVINNSITVLSGGNGLVINPHPTAQRCTCQAVQLVDNAIVAAGGPRNLVTVISNPTIESGLVLMKHPKTAASLITGGPAVVKIAMTSGKRSICAGPGNPPVVVDETADIDFAGRKIVEGASFDNNMICTDEKECFVVESVADRLIAAMQNAGAYLIPQEKLNDIEKVIFDGPVQDNKEVAINKKWVGQNISVILKEIGVQVPESTKLAIVEVPRTHSLVWTEQLMPVFPIVRVDNVDDGIFCAKAAEAGRRHTASMFSSNIHNLTKMAREVPVSIFVKNGPTLAGIGVDAEGFTSFSIAGTTGEGMTRPETFTRERRVTVMGAMRII